jgi:hypothetical protein
MNEPGRAAFFALVERSLALSADRIVAVALLSQREVDRLSGVLEHCYPVADEGTFDHLLAQLDHIDIEAFGKGVVMRPTIRNG